MRLTIGFDLDMTLVDSRAGIVRCMQLALRPRGVEATEAQLWPLVGAPLTDNLARFLPADQVPGAAADYRRHYLVQAIGMTTVMPGARELVDAIRAGGGRVLVVSAKHPDAVRATLEHVGLRVDELAGDLFAERKGPVLREHAAAAYVGDHSGDMRAARTAGAYAIGVLTGPQSAEQLWQAGADAVVARLSEVAPILDEFGPDGLTR